jgi:hypothetical protein
MLNIARKTPSTPSSIPIFLMGLFNTVAEFLLDPVDCGAGSIDDEPGEGGVVVSSELSWPGTPARTVDEAGSAVVCGTDANAGIYWAR